MKLRLNKKSKGRSREAGYLQAQETVCFKGQAMYVLREAVRLVESLQSDRVSAVVEWLAVSHGSCDGVVVDDVARVCSYMFGRGGCRSVVQ